MRTLFLASLVALPLLAAPAFADDSRMSTLEFSRANRCLAYAGLDSLRGDGADFSALQQRFDAAFAAKPFPVRHDAAEEARRIRITAKGAASERELATLRARRDLECRSFASGLSARSGDAPSGD